MRIFIVVLIIAMFCGINSYSQNRHSDIDSLHDVALSLIKNETKKAIQLLDSTQVLSKNRNYEYGISRHMLLDAIVDRIVGENERAEEKLKKYLDIVDSTQYNNVGRAQLNLAQVYSSIDNSPKSIEYAQKAAETFRRAGSNTLLGVAYNELAMNYRFNRQYEEAREYYFKGIELIENAGDTSEVSGLYANIGNTYGWEGQFDKAEEYYRKAIEIDSRYNDRLGLFYNYENLGNLYGRRGNLTKALEYFTMSMSYLEGTELIKEQAVGNQRLGQVHMMTKSYDKALSYFNKALTYAEKAGMREAIRSLNYNIATTYAGKGNYKIAYEQMVRQKNIADSLYNETINENIAEANTKYETAAKEKEIAELQYEDELNNQHIIRQKIIIGISVLGILLLSGFLYVLFNQKKQITLKNQIISKSLSEKETLLKEIHHRVKNNLQFISSLLGLQTEHVSDQVALGALQEGQDRVQSMALIHQNLYQEDNLTGVDMHDYFVKLVRGLFDSYNIRRDQINLELDIEDLNLDVDTVIPIGLIVNELVSNSLKYAFPKGTSGTIKVTLNEIDETLIVSVKDNGVGITKEQQKQIGTSFGYRLINVFKDQLHATLNIDGTDGTEVAMLISSYKKAQVA